GKGADGGRLGSLAAASGFCLGHAALWLVLSRQVRFLLPSLAVLAALIEAGLPRALAAGWPRAVGTAALHLGIGFNVLLISTHFASHNPLPVVLGLEPEGRYLRREVPGGDYAVFEHIDGALPPDARILFGASGN